MTLALKTLALAATIGVTATLSATANGHRGDAKEAVLFKDPDFRGAAIAIDGPVYNLRPLGFNDTISSIDIRGAWEVCVDPDFRGRCVVIDGPTAHLTHLRMNDNISSMRPLRGGSRRVGNRRDDRYDDHGRRGGGDFRAHNRGIEGRNTVFFPRPRDAFGDPIRGGRGNASDFCRDMGLGRAVYADTSRRNTTDILCAK